MYYLNNVIGSAEIAKITNKNKLTIRRWADAGKLPKPLYTVGGVFVWDRTEVFKSLNALGCLTACNDDRYTVEGVQK